MQFVNRLRINLACQLLMGDAAMRITHVCFSSGFNNISNFNRQFLAQKRMTPSQFRVLLGENEAAAVAAHKVFQANPFWSMAHVLLAATQTKIGRLGSATAAAARVLELQPGFTISGLCASFDVDPLLAVPLSEALLESGLPA